MKQFNSVEYAWKDIEVVLLGRPLVRILEVEYTVETEQKVLYGRGKKGLGIQSMNESVSGSITIGQSELEAMTAKVNEVAPGAKLTDFVLDLNIGYLAGTDIIRDRVVSLKFSQIPKSMKQGDADMEVKLPFQALDIEYNI